MSATGEGPVARQVHYSGRVQGVGFRVTTARLARGFAVAGWVRNLPDGRVQLHAEGAPGEVGRFLAAVRERFGGYIADEAIEEVAPAGQYRAFEITR
jgi:acylphosphatase